VKFIESGDELVRLFAHQNLFKFDQEELILSGPNSKQSSEFLNDLNEAVFSLESCVDYFNEYNQIFNVNGVLTAPSSSSSSNLIQNTEAWTNYENLNFFEEDKQVNHHHHQIKIEPVSNENNEDENGQEKDENEEEEEEEDEEEDEGDRERENEKRVPNSAEALNMFNSLKRFLAKYTPDSNDVIFDLEKKVTQGIENSKKFKKFCFN
jgi:anion-transporting  ArsA/GET3 family ATPase